MYVVAGCAAAVTFAITFCLATIGGVAVVDWLGWRASIEVQTGALSLAAALVVYGVVARSRRNLGQQARLNLVARARA